MPQSISIAAFVFGAVLLLIALLKGGFKIFGAEVAANAGKGARVIAGIVGVVFLLIGLGASTQDPPREAKEAAKEKTPPAQAQSKTTFTEVSSLLQTAAVPAQIGGHWRDNAGVVYQITQAGDQINIIGQYGQSQASGSGHVKQQQVEFEYQTNYSARGRGRLTVSADGRQMTGNFHEVGPNGSSQFQRVFFR